MPPGSNRPLWTDLSVTALNNQTTHKSFNKTASNLGTNFLYNQGLQIHRYILSLHLDIKIVPQYLDVYLYNAPSIKSQVLYTGVRRRILTI